MVAGEEAGGATATSVDAESLFLPTEAPDARSSTISALGSVLRSKTPWLQVSGTAWFRSYKVAMRRARCARHLCVGGRVGRVSGCSTAPDRETQTQASAPMVVKPPRVSEDFICSILLPLRPFFWGLTKRMDDLIDLVYPNVSNLERRDFVLQET